MYVMQVSDQVVLLYGRIRAVRALESTSILKRKVGDIYTCKLILLIK